MHIISINMSIRVDWVTNQYTNQAINHKCGGYSTHLPNRLPAAFIK